ncbi:MAG: hypothetical protein RI894_1829, partial [Bacteroidota bacterium]
MKIAIVWSIIIIFASNYTFSQPLADYKRDYIWHLGYDGWPQNPDYRLMSLNFATTPFTLTSTYDSTGFYMANASICDSVGNLVFQTNNVLVYDKNNRLMTASLLNPGDWATDPEHGYLFMQTALILPLPNSNHLYYLIHQKINDPHAGPYSGEGLYYTIVDSNLRNGAGGVSSWRNVVVRDSFECGKLNAVRHANGRDWWVTCWQRGFTKYRLCLLDPIGLHDLGWQQLPVIPSFPNDGQSCFSEDGSTFVAVTYNPTNNKTRIDIMDFDRCLGLLTNHRQFYTVANGYFFGLSIAPNSRYFYTCSPDIVLQYDLQATDIANSGDTVAVYDGFRDSTYLNFLLSTQFWLAQLAADGKIYISTANGTKYLHTIESPNERGVACNLRQHSVHLPAFMVRGLPNYPNFRLGPVDGSACDTLGFNEVNSPAHAPPETGGFIKV